MHPKKDELGLRLDPTGDESRIAVGAHQRFKARDTTTMGHAQSFHCDDNPKQWQQLRCNLVGSKVTGAFGSQVKHSADGLVLAVDGNLGDAINGLDSGYTQVFDLTGFQVQSRWIRVKVRTCTDICVQTVASAVRPHCLFADEAEQTTLFLFWTVQFDHSENRISMWV